MTLLLKNLRVQRYSFFIKNKLLKKKITYFSLHYIQRVTKIGSAWTKKFSGFYEGNGKNLTNVVFVSLLLLFLSIEKVLSFDFLFNRKDMYYFSVLQQNKIFFIHL
jgi:hypothetical protein